MISRGVSVVNLGLLLAVVCLLLSSFANKQVPCASISLLFISGQPRGREAGGWRLLALQCLHLQVGGTELPTCIDTTLAQNK